jgi:hypothetical protein
MVATVSPGAGRTGITSGRKVSTTARTPKTSPCEKTSFQSPPDERIVLPVVDADAVDGVAEHLPGGLDGPFGHRLDRLGGDEAAGGVAGDVLAPLARERHEREVGVALADPTEELDAVRHRHLVVAHHAVERRLGQQLQAGLRGFGGGDREAVAFEERRGEVE